MQPFLDGDDPRIRNILILLPGDGDEEVGFFIVTKILDLQRPEGELVFRVMAHHSDALSGSTPTAVVFDSNAQEMFTILGAPCYFVVDDIVELHVDTMLDLLIRQFPNATIVGQ